jgi:hypothetical protein
MEHVIARGKLGDLDENTFSGLLGNEVQPCWSRPFQVESNGIDVMVAGNANARLIGGQPLGVAFTVPQHGRESRGSDIDLLGGCKPETLKILQPIQREDRVYIEIGR